MTTEYKEIYRKTTEYENNLKKISGEIPATTKERKRIAARVKGVRLVSYLKNDLEWSDEKVKKLLSEFKPNALDQYYWGLNQ